MTITADTLISEIAAAEPATIRVFQQHQIDFCCGGRIPLAEASVRRGLDPDRLVAELHATRHVPQDSPDWENATLAALIDHIQTRYHEPLRTELPRLSVLLAKVVIRHSDRYPDFLLPLQFTFADLESELLSHMNKEDAILFPAIVAAEAAVRESGAPVESWLWIEQPLAAIVAEHASAGAALATMRSLTRGYVPPEGVCPTFRGLYHGLAELERDMHVHVHLENNILFPRAARLAFRA